MCYKAPFRVRVFSYTYLVGTEQKTYQNMSDLSRVPVVPTPTSLDEDIFLRIFPMLQTGTLFRLISTCRCLLYAGLPTLLSRPFLLYSHSNDPVLCYRRKRMSDARLDLHRSRESVRLRARRARNFLKRQLASSTGTTRTSIGHGLRSVANLFVSVQSSAQAVLCGALQLSFFRSWSL